MAKEEYKHKGKSDCQYPTVFNTVGGNAGSYYCCVLILYYKTTEEQRAYKGVEKSSRYYC